MQLKDMLFPECTLIHVKADRKEDVIWKLYEKLLQNGKVKENFYEAVLEREREYPTGLKFEKWEVAIPHVSPEYVLESTIAIAVLDEPVEFKRMDDESSVHVNVVFNIALGKDGKQIEILQDIIHRGGQRHLGVAEPALHIEWEIADLRIQCIVRILQVGEDLLEDLGIAETIDPQPECRSFPQPEITCDQVKTFTQRKQSVEKINILGKFCG